MLRTRPIKKDGHQNPRVHLLHLRGKDAFQHSGGCSSRGGGGYRWLDVVIVQNRDAGSGETLSVLCMLNRGQFESMKRDLQRAEKVLLHGSRLGSQDAWWDC